MATDSRRRLHHHTPAWVEAEAVFHIRLRLHRDCPARLTDAPLGRALLESARYYHDHLRWRCRLFLLMPDHSHALLSFSRESDMTKVVGRWKAWQTRQLGLIWQENFFDHRIRHAHDLQIKGEYIRQNPVVKGLCPRAEDWPWVYDPGRTG